MRNEILLADYLIKLLPLEQVMRQMYHSDDLYSRIPQLLFRISKDLDESIYDELRECLESFDGNLKWTEFKSFVGKKIFNHTICPKRYYDKHKYMYEKNILLSDNEYFSDKEYKYLCEKGIEDIPKLFEHIKKTFTPNLEQYKK